MLTLIKTGHPEDLPLSLSLSLTLSLTCLSSPHISVSLFISFNVCLSSAALVFVAESQSQEMKGRARFLSRAWNSGPVGIFGMPLGEEENLYCLYCSLSSSRGAYARASHLRVGMEKKIGSSRTHPEALPEIPLHR